jgi:hypothetical protein
MNNLSWTNKRFSVEQTPRQAVLSFLKKCIQPADKISHTPTRLWKLPPGCACRKFQAN